MLSGNCKHTPYWWDSTPRPTLPSTTPLKQVDVAVIGSGYTGLHAALVTARAGRSTLIFDADDAGAGCSTRNGGQISTSVKPNLKLLTKRYGSRTAHKIIREGHTALGWINDFIKHENIACDFKICGRFHAAHSQRAFNRLVAQTQHQAPGLEVPVDIIPPSEQRSEIGTNRYHGGVVYHQHASLDPAKYHQGLIDCALKEGVNFCVNSTVTKLTQRASGYQISTAQGELHAEQVVIATNGYTGSLTPWQRRRVIPIGSYIIATDIIDPVLMQNIMPTDRIFSDTRRVVYYYRPSPDRKRILFGGRVSSTETNTSRSGRLLKQDLDDLFPELADVPVSHSWMGFVAYTFDTLAHIGQKDQLFYAMGYCGSGVSMASYLGMRLGHKVIDSPDGKTAFDDLPFPSRPLYTGKPWFLPATVACYRWLDNLER